MSLEWHCRLVQITVDQKRCDNERGRTPTPAPRTTVVPNPFEHPLQSQRCCDKECGQSHDEESRGTSLRIEKWQVTDTRPRFDGLWFYIQTYDKKESPTDEPR